MATLEPLHRATDPARPHVVVFHGLGDHPRTTWVPGGYQEQKFWLHWLGEATDCSIWSAGYDAALSVWREEAMSLPEQGTQLLELLATHTELKNRSLVLIGHSLGGLVIKQMIFNGRSLGVLRHRAVVERIRGVSFIATPHGGSHLANLARLMSILLRTNEQVGDLTAQCSSESAERTVSRRSR